MGKLFNFYNLKKKKKKKNNKKLKKIIIYKLNILL